MNEFSLIDLYFKKSALQRADVVFGIGDDAACLDIPVGQQLLVSTDTLVAEVHFLSSWDAYDIAYKAVMVNVSDIAAMGGQPVWMSLALTLPELDEAWLGRFSEGLHETLGQFGIALIGGDTTRGPLSLTLTIHGFIPEGKAVRRSGAKPGDKVYISGDLGAAALAVAYLYTEEINVLDKAALMNKLKYPKPRVDLASLLQNYASAAIDISDGLSADLNHILVASGVGACLEAHLIPAHPLVQKYRGDEAIRFALTGGDDYELAFTVPAEKEDSFLAKIGESGLKIYPIGVIEKQTGLRLKDAKGEISPMIPSGYSHF